MACGETGRAPSGNGSQAEKASSSRVADAGGLLQQTFLLTTRNCAAGSPLSNENTRCIINTDNQYVYIPSGAVQSCPVHINENRKGESIKKAKWHANQGVDELSGNFTKPILKVAILRSHVL